MEPPCSYSQGCKCKRLIRHGRFAVSRSVRHTAEIEGPGQPGPFKGVSCERARDDSTTQRRDDWGSCEHSGHQTCDPFVRGGREALPSRVDCFFGQPRCQMDRLIRRSPAGIGAGPTYWNDSRNTYCGGELGCHHRSKPGPGAGGSAVLHRAGIGILTALLALSISARPVLYTTASRSRSPNEGGLHGCDLAGDALASSVLVNGHPTLIRRVSTTRRTILRQAEAGSATSTLWRR